MVELFDNRLFFIFPEVNEKAGCGITFQRTLRIPDDNREYPLPPGLDRFPVRHVDDFSRRLPETWARRGGVFIPMYQSEALWIEFAGRYPCAVKVAAGKINAISGGTWENSLSQDPQDYCVLPAQGWLDGFNVSEDHVRQFVAMPLGEGYTAEEQVTGTAEHGGIQIIVYPMKSDAYAELMSARPMLRRGMIMRTGPEDAGAADAKAVDMGLGLGGLMQQRIYEDRYGIDVWDQTKGLRCFVHLANSAMYQKITGQRPPQKPPTAEAYTEAGLPWFDYYSDAKPLPGSHRLGKLSSVAARMIEKGRGLLRDNESVQPGVVKKLGKGAAVRIGDF